MAIKIRVYGILINADNEVLLSDERYKGKQFTKFPGGGVEQGEGLKDALKREFIEELNLVIEINKLIYLTDFYQASAFNKDDQIISIYYEVSTENPSEIHAVKTPFHFINEKKESQRWKKVSDLTEQDLNLPIDKIVVKHLKKLYCK